MNVLAKPEIRIMTGVYRPERAEALKQAAAETAGKIAVKFYDASEPDERDTFAQLSVSNDIRLYSSGIVDASGERHTIRTPDQIRANVIEPAVRKGLALVAITHHEPDLGSFWNRVDQIAEPSR